MTQKDREIQLQKYIQEGGSVIFPPKDPNDAEYGAVFGFKGEKQRDWRPFAPKFEEQLRSYFCTN